MIVDGAATPFGSIARASPKLTADDPDFEKSPYCGVLPGIVAQPGRYFTQVVIGGVVVA